MLDEIPKIIAKYQHSPLVDFVEKVRLVNTTLQCKTTFNPFVRGNKANLGADVGLVLLLDSKSLKKLAGKSTVKEEDSLEDQRPLGMASGRLSR